MKSLLITTIYMLLLSATISCAKTNGMIVSDCGKDCVQVETDNNTIRVYKCGKVEKLTWKEINPNEDNMLTSAGALTLPDSTPLRVSRFDSFSPSDLQTLDSLGMLQSSISSFYDLTEEELRECNGSTAIITELKETFGILNVISCRDWLDQKESRRWVSQQVMEYNDQIQNLWKKGGECQWCTDSCITFPHTTSKVEKEESWSCDTCISNCFPDSLQTEE